MIVQIFRAIACATRLRILAQLMRCHEVTPSQLARDLHLRLDVLSLHLSRLASAGIIQRRRSGAKHYCSARSPYGGNALSGQVLAWLRDALAAATQGVPPGTSAASDTSRPHLESHRVVFEAATAFTHPRRIQIIRRLTGGRPPDAVALMRELRMSDRAVSRHTDKLVRRGYVRALPSARGTTYQLLREGKTPLHGRLLAILRRHWAGRDVAR